MRDKMIIRGKMKVKKKLIIMNKKMERDKMVIWMEKIKIMKNHKNLKLMKKVKI